VECHFGYDRKAKRSRVNHNLFNVGNTDNGANKYFNSYEEGIEAYFKLMHKHYLWADEGMIVTIDMMRDHNFWRPDKVGQYASDPNYTHTVCGIADKISHDLYYHIGG
jgi:hypothetical protein